MGFGWRLAIRIPHRAATTMMNPWARWCSPGVGVSPTNGARRAYPKARPVVVLRQPTGPTAYADFEGSIQGLLLRELVRQAVLIAARDELGLTTRDEILGEAPPGGWEAANEAAEVVSSFRVEVAASRLFVLNGGEGAPETLLKNDLLPGSPADFDYLPRLVAALEAMARGEIPGALKKAGLPAGERNKLRPDATLPGDVGARLERLGFIENLTAVRDLHAAIRADGESPMRLAALARGYAQLGVLSEFQWHPACYAFKARALLSAQRLVAREPSASRTLRARALVLVLVGRPDDARADLREASKAKDAASAAPDWLPVIEATLDNRTDRLKSEAGPHASLAALLRMMAVQFPIRSAEALAAAKAVIAREVDCFRAHDAMCGVSGVANLHVATEMGPQVLDRLFPEKLGQVAGLPAKVREALDDEDGDKPSLLEALRSAGAPAEDPAEPSWGVLAHLVRETQFVQAYRRLYFLRNMLSVPTGIYWAGVRASVAGHRYFPFLESLARPQAELATAILPVADRIDLNDIGYNEVFMLQMLRPYARDRAELALHFVERHGDLLVRDLSDHIISTAPKDAVAQAKRLLRVDPRSVFAMATLIDLDWDAIKDKVPAWEKQEGDAPALLGALGGKYAALKQHDKARETLTRFIRKSPEAWAYKLMAEVYKDQGDLTKWKATLDEYLAKGEDHGLSHAGVRVEIADWFMDQKRWAEAKPYADAAAETWAGWAMSCAMRCHEGLKEWDEAEAWAYRLTERYPRDSWDTWYLFCKRTGRGDLKGARDMARGYLAATLGNADIDKKWNAGFFYWLTGEYGPARELLEPMMAIDPLESSIPLHLTLIADAAGDTRRRDELLGQIWDRYQGQAPRAAQVCRALREWLARGKKGDPDLALVDRTIARAKPEHRGPLEFFVGVLLVRHKRPDLGKPYLRRCVESTTISEWVRLLAKDALDPPRPQPRTKTRPKNPTAPPREPDNKLTT